MAVLLTPFFLQFADDIGVPIKNGFVYTFAAGSVNTPKAAYTDFTETVPLPNPVPLDAAGRCTIWINGSYKLVLTDALGNIIKTTDNVTSFSVPAASANAFFQSFSGNNSQTVFPLSADLGTDPKAVLAFVDQGAGKGYEPINPNQITLTSGSTPTIGFSVVPATGVNNIFVWEPSQLLGAASAAAAQAQASATQAAASAVTASAASLSGTSTTSVTIGTGTKNFTTQTGKNYTPGAWLVIASAANVANYMFGQIVSYNSTTGALQISVPAVTNATGGSGTFADWIINIAGVQGVQGATGTGVANMLNQTFVSGTGFTPGSTASLTLTNTPISASASALHIIFDGIEQHASEWSYNPTTGVITFNSAIPLGVSAVFCYWFTDIAVGTPSNGTVTANKIVDGVISYQKMLATDFASAAQIVANTVSKFVDAQGLYSVLFGVNQTWQSVTRIGGTTYTNSTNRPIVVQQAITTAGNNTLGTCSCTVNGVAVTVATCGGAAVAQTVGSGNIVIPVGATYVFTYTNCSASTWELR